MEHFMDGNTLSGKNPFVSACVNLCCRIKTAFTYLTVGLNNLISYYTRYMHTRPCGENTYTEYKICHEQTQKGTLLQPGKMRFTFTKIE